MEEGNLPWSPGAVPTPMGGTEERFTLSPTATIETCYEIDEGIVGCDRLYYIMERKNFRQYYSVVLSIRKIFKEDFSLGKIAGSKLSCFSKMFDLLIDVLVPPSAKAETLAEVFSESITRLCKSGELNSDTLHSIVVPGLVKVLECYVASTAVTKAVLEALESALLEKNTLNQFTVPRAIIEKRVLPYLVEEHLGYGTPACCRCFAIRTIGTICQHKLVGGKYIEDYVVEVIIQSCNDENADVRQSACEQLTYVCQAIPKHHIQSHISKEIYNLLLDSNFEVRNEAVKTAVKLIFVFPPRFRREKVFPLFQAATEIDRKSTEFLRAFPTVLPILLDYLKNDKTTFSLFGAYLLRWYLSLAKSEVEEHRFICAFNFPFMVSNYGVVEDGYEKYSFHAIAYDTLCRDSSFKIRQTMASHLHELLLLLGKMATRNKLIAAFNLFLEDRNPAVQASVVKNLGIILKIISPHLGKSKSLTLKSILRHEIAIEGNWRLQTTFINSFPLFWKHFDHTDVYSWCPAILHGYIRHGAAPIQQPAADILIMLSRKCFNGRHRIDMVENIKIRYFESDSFFKRRSFLKLCDAWLKIYSYAFFKANVWPLMEASVKVEVLPVLQKESLKLLKRLAVLASGNNDACVVESIKSVIMSIAKQKTNDSLSKIAFEAFKYSNQVQSDRALLDEVLAADDMLAKQEASMPDTMNHSVTTYINCGPISSIPRKGEGKTVSSVLHKTLKKKGLYSKNKLKISPVVGATKSPVTPGETNFPRLKMKSRVTIPESGDSKPTKKTAVMGSNKNGGHSIMKGGQKMIAKVPTAPNSPNKRGLQKISQVRRQRLTHNIAGEK